MAMIWRLRAVRLSEVDDEDGTGTWEPFGVFYDAEEADAVVLVKGLFEVEGEKSSTRDENKIWTPDE